MEEREAWWLQEEGGGEGLIRVEVREEAGGEEE